MAWENSENLDFSWKYHKYPHIQSWNSARAMLAEDFHKSAEGFRRILGLLGCPIFTKMSPNLLDRRYVDIYGISMGNQSFQSFPMPFRSPTKPIHFTKEIENLRG